MKFLVVMFGVLVGFCITQHANAQGLPDSCDPDFNEVIKARATLSATRDIEVAQTLILKPDSVLEYSCFVDGIKPLSRNKSLFSNNMGSPLFEDPPETFTPSGDFAHLLPTIDETGMTAPGTGQAIVEVGPNPPGDIEIHSALLGNTLGSIVVDNEFSYNVSNFGHDYYGDFFSGIPVDGICNPMMLVWEEARCSNFKKSSFITFQDMVSSDPRVVLSYTPLDCNVTDRASDLQDTIDAAFPVAGAAGGIDIATTHLGIMDPQDCAASPPIKTGVQVYAGSPPDIVHEDAVCLASGCYYDGTSCNP